MPSRGSAFTVATAVLRSTPTSRKGDFAATPATLEFQIPVGIHVLIAQPSISFIVFDEFQGTCRMMFILLMFLRCLLGFHEMLLSPLIS